jgi:hypothetical protein
MKTYLAIATAVVVLSSPALAAEYYLGQDPETKKCKIVETKPDGDSLVMVGTETYASKDEAKAARKASAECKKRTES